MHYDIQIKEVGPQPLAATRGRANARNISERFLALLDEVWAFLKASEVPNLGINVAIYRCAEGDFFGDEGVPIEGGVLVKSKFAAEGRIMCSQTPSGRVAGTLHIGSYQKLGEAHNAVHRWCADNGHKLAGPNWEIYGHWTANDDELQTEVLYLLA